MVDVLVVAGSPNEKTLKEVSKASYEALIEIEGKPMLSYVLEALQKSSKINRVVVVGPKEIIPVLPSDFLWANSKNSLLENVEVGIDALKDSKQVLFLTSDIPLITTKAIEDFLKLCQKRTADLYYSAISKEVVEEKYPDTKRTYVKLKEGKFTGGSLVLFNPAVFKKCIPTGKKIIEARKQPLKICKILGYGFLLKFVLGLVDLEEAEKKVSGILGVNGAVIISSYAEIGVDVDKVDDFNLVSNILHIT